jgi:hypothetical protein
MKWLFEFWVRREACKMAAIAIQNHTDEDSIAPRLWSLAVFFESYMHEGCEGTMADFGPREPVELSAVVTDVQ